MNHRSQILLCHIMCWPVKGGLRQTVHPGLQLQTGILSERWDDEREDQSQAHKSCRQDHLGGRWQNWKTNHWSVPVSSLLEMLMLLNLKWNIRELQLTQSLWKHLMFSETAIKLWVFFREVIAKQTDFYVECPHTKTNIIETKRKLKAMNKIMTIMADKN